MSDDTVRVSWPIGPEYTAWVSEENDTARAWSMYKLRTAIWYIDILEDLGARPWILRLVGIEMALDGAVTTLSSAFEPRSAASSMRPRRGFKFGRTTRGRQHPCRLIRGNTRGRSPGGIFKVVRSSDRSQTL